MNPSASSLPRNFRPPAQSSCIPLVRQATRLHHPSPRVTEIQIQIAAFLLIQLQVARRVQDVVDVMRLCSDRRLNLAVTPPLLGRKATLCFRAYSAPSLPERSPPLSCAICPRSRLIGCAVLPLLWNALMDPPPLPPFDLPLTILAFRERFNFDLAVTDLFADFSVYEDMTRSFNGTVAFLATYREARNGNTYVPAWVNFGNVCWFCRTKSHPRNETKDCTFSPCRRCNKTGHRPRLCPVRPVAREGALHASSANRTVL